MAYFGFIKLNPESVQIITAMVTDVIKWHLRQPASKMSN